MKNYFYIDKTTQQQKGPFAPEQLKTLNIQPDTMVWCSGMDGWRMANTVHELAFLFSPATQSPPPVQQQANNGQKTHPPYQWKDVNGAVQAQQEQKFDYMFPVPKNWLIESILATVFCCPPFGIAGIINAAKVESHYYAGNYPAAEKASKDAKKWTLVSLFIWVGLITLYFLFIFIFSFISAFS